MRRIIAALILGTTTLVAVPPALASYGAIVALPEGSTYSPYGGPATVTFTFDTDDPAAVFTVRLRRPGHGVLDEDDYLVDPAIHMSPHPVAFDWKDLSVGTATDYVIEVRRQGGETITSEPFTVVPPLVSDLSASPSPFYPVIEDGYRDESTIRFSLAADTAETAVRIYADDPYGRCCGPLIREHDLGPLAAGQRRWDWDGTRDDASLAPKGAYFVRVAATDTDGASTVSRPLKVEVANGWIRRTATKEKPGSAFARAGDERENARGGDCTVNRDRAQGEALIVCANAAISVTWRWALGTKERIESVAFVIDDGAFTCARTKQHTAGTSTIRVSAPPTSTCEVTAARIRYSYRVEA